MEVSGTLEKKSRTLWNFLFHVKEALSGFWNCPEELRILWNITEQMFLYLAYDIIVLS